LLTVMFKSLVFMTLLKKNEGNGKTDKEINREEYSSCKKINRNKK